MGEQEMGKQNGLCVLHVRHTGHGHAKICFGLLKKRAQQLENAGLNLLRRGHDEEAKIGGDKLIAASAGVQLPSERAKFMHERTFDEMVNVLHRGAVQERWVALDLRFEIVEGQERVMHFRRGENANGLQSPGPCAVDRDFVWQKASIKRKRPLERVEVLIRLALEAAAPEAVIFTLGLCSHRVSISVSVSVSVSVCRLLLKPPEAASDRRCLTGAQRAAPLQSLSVVAAFGLRFRADRYREREKVDEAFGVLGIVAAHGEAGEVGAIEREGRDALGDGERTLPQFEADGASDTLLRRAEKSIQRRAQR
jgi:hypothetical protein